VRKDVGISLQATHFAFLYPMDGMINLAKDLDIAGPDRWACALMFGGFAYFNRWGKLLHVNAITLLEEQNTVSLHLVGPFNGNDRFAVRMHEHGRQPIVTIEFLKSAGFETFGWVHPEETIGEEHVEADVDLASKGAAPNEHGAFLYHYSAVGASPSKRAKPKVVYFAIEPGEPPAPVKGAVPSRSGLSGALNKVRAKVSRGDVQGSGKPPRKLSLQQRKLWHLFEQCDVDKSGRVESSEMLEQLTCQGYTMTKREHDLFLQKCKQADRDGSGDLDFYEFLELASELSFLQALPRPDPISYLILWEMSVMCLVFLSFLTHSFSTIGPLSLWEAADGSLLLYTVFMFRDGFQYAPHRMMVYAVTALGYFLATVPFLLGSAVLPAPTGYDKAGNTRRVLTEGMKHDKWDREHTGRESEEAEAAEGAAKSFLGVVGEMSTHFLRGYWGKDPAAETTQVQRPQEEKAAAEAAKTPRKKSSSPGLSFHSLGASSSVRKPSSILL